MTQDTVDASVSQQTVAAQRVPSIASNTVNPTPPTLAALSTASITGSSPIVSTTVAASSKDNIMIPSDNSIAFLPPAGATSSQNTSNSVVPVHAGIGVGFPMPHPGDGSMDFSKTEMVTPETSLNMSIAAFLSRYTF